jgi:hypothetical protein
MGAHHAYLSTQFKDLLIWSQTRAKFCYQTGLEIDLIKLKWRGKLTRDLNKFEWDLIKLIIIVFFTHLIDGLVIRVESKEFAPSMVSGSSIVVANMMTTVGLHGR